MGIRSARSCALGVAVVLVLGMTVSLSADRVRLRSGKIVEGMFMGGDSKSVRVLLDDGSVSEIPLEEATAVEFSARKPKPAPAPAPAAKPAPAPAPAAQAPAPAAAPKPVTVPAGTMLNVRLAQAIDVDTSATGQTFKAIVDDPVMIGGSVVIPRGASAVVQAVKVEQSGKMKGSDKVTLKLNAIGFGGFVYPVSSSYNQSKGKGEGKRTGRKVGGGAGLGAIVGGIAGGGTGAAIGAVAGGTGAVLATKGKEVEIPPGTVVSALLQSALTIRVPVK